MTLTRWGNVTIAAALVACGDSAATSIVADASLDQSASSNAGAVGADAGGRDADAASSPRCPGAPSTLPTEESCWALDQCPSCAGGFTYTCAGDGGRPPIYGCAHTGDADGGLSCCPPACVRYRVGDSACAIEHPGKPYHWACARAGDAGTPPAAAPALGCALRPGRGFAASELYCCP